MRKSFILTSTDVFLLLMLIFTIFGAGFRFWTLRKESADKQQSYAVTGIWKEQNTETVKAIQAGDILYTPSGILFGTVEKVVVSPSVITLTDNRNTASGTYPDKERSDVTLTVSVLGTVSGKTLLRGGKNPVWIGETYQLYTHDTAVSLLILKVD